MGNLNRYVISVICIILIVCAACDFNRKCYYLGPLNITVSIEDRGLDLYRIYLTKGNGDSRHNYIDVNYHSSDMPSIQLYFPHNKSDTICVKDMYADVKQYQSRDFHIIVSRRDIHSDGIFYGWTDSTFYKVPSTVIRLEPRMDGIRIWDENGKFQYWLRR